MEGGKVGKLGRLWRREGEREGGGKEGGMEEVIHKHTFGVYTSEYMYACNTFLK